MNEPLDLRDAREADDENCPNSRDGLGHCQHWWEGDPCCWCDAGEMSMEDKVRNGMVEGPPRKP